MNFIKSAKEKLEQMKGNLNSLKNDVNRNVSEEKLVDLGYKENKNVISRGESLEALYKEYGEATPERKEQIRMELEHRYGKVPSDFSLDNESQGKSR